MLRRGSKLLRVRPVMLIAKRKTCADASRLKKESNLLESGTTDDVAACISNYRRNPVRIIYAGHFDIPAFMILLIVCLASLSSSA